jgi:hypothetical protein
VERAGSVPVLETFRSERSAREEEIRSKQFRESQREDPVPEIPVLLQFCARKR